MTTKLTLTVEKDVIERAKAYAQSTGRSLSEIVTAYLDGITKAKDKEEMSPKLARLVGAITLPDGFDEEQTLSDNLRQKHG